jgi:hypothetical protein
VVLTTPASPTHLSESIRRHINGLAKEIARRVREGHNCEAAAREVLLDWFLGDFIPSQSSTGGSHAAEQKGSQD